METKICEFVNKKCEKSDGKKCIRYNIEFKDNKMDCGCELCKKETK